MMGLRTYALSLIITLLLGLGFTSVAKGREDLKAVVEIEALYTPIPLRAPVTWIDCDGDWNGLYYFSGRIELCDGNIDLGLGAARFIYLHELGHAWTFSRGFTYERWAGNYEAAADEFAAIHSIARGHAEDVLAMARVFEAWGKTHPGRAGDPHPPALKRADTLRRLYWGWKMFAGERTIEFYEALDFWMDKTRIDTRT